MMSASQDKCPICKEDLVSPKLLDCVHAFCSACLEGYCVDKRPGDDIQCPICRTTTRIPDKGLCALPNQEFPRADEDEDGDQEDLCEVCWSEATSASASSASKPAAAAVLCVDCLQKLCDRCSLSHLKWRGGAHNVIPLSVAEWELTQKQSVFCGEHARVRLSLYCYDCRMNICSDCFAKEHRNHKCEDIETVAGEKLKELDTDTRELESRIACIRQEARQIDIDLRQFADEALLVERKVEKQAQKLRKTLDSQMREMMQELERDRLMVLDQMKTRKESTESSLILMESFNKYCYDLRVRHQPSLVTCVVDELRSRARHLLHVHTATDDYTSPHISFTPTSLDELLVGKGKNLVGSLNIGESLATKSWQPGVETTRDPSIESMEAELSEKSAQVVRLEQLLTKAQQRNDDLESKLRRESGHVKNLENELQLARSSTTNGSESSLREEIEDLRLELELYKERSAKIDDDKDSLRALLSEAEEKVVNLEGKLNLAENQLLDCSRVADDQIQSLQQQAEQAKADLLHYEEAEHLQRAKMSECEKRVSELERELEETRDKLMASSETESALSTAQSTLGEVRKQLEGTNKELGASKERERKLAEQLTEQESKMMSLLSELRATSEELSATKSQRNVQNQKAVDLENKIKDLIARSSSNDSRLDAAESLDEKLKAAQSELEESKATERSLRSSLSKSDEKVISLEQQLKLEKEKWTETMKLVSDLQTELNQSKEKVISLQADLEVSQNKQLQIATANKPLEAMISKSEDTAKKKEIELTEMTKKLAESRSVEKALQNTLAEANSEITRIQQELDETKQESDDKVGELRNQLKGTQDELRAANSREKALNEKLADAEKNISKLSDERKQACEQLSANSAWEKSQTEELNETRAKLTALTNDCEKKLQSLEQELAKQREQLKTAANSEASLQATVKENQAQIENKIVELEKVSEQLKESKTTETKLREALQESELAMKQLQQQLSKTHEQVTTYRSDVDRLQKGNLLLSEKIIELQDQHKQTEKTEAKDAAKKMTREQDHMKRKLSASTDREKLQDKRIKEAERQLEMLTRDNEAKVQCMRQELTKLQEQLKTAANSEANLQATVKENQALVANKTVELDRVSEQLIESKVAEKKLRETLQERELAVKQLQQRLSKTQEQLATYKCDVERLHKENLLLSGKICELGDQQKQTEKALLEGAVTETMFQSNLTEAKDAVKKMTKELDHVKEKLSASTDSDKIQVERTTEAERQLELLKRDNESKVLCLTHEVTKLDEQLKTAASAEAKLQASLKENQALVANKTIELEKATEQLKEGKTTENTLRKTLQERELAMKKLQQELSKTQEQLATYKNDVERVQKGNLSDFENEAQKRERVLKVKLANSETVATKLSAELKQAREKLMASTNREKSQIEKLKEAEEELTALKSDREEKVRCLQQELEQLDQQLKKAVSSETSLQAVVTDQKTQVETLQQQLNVSNEQLSASRSAEQSMKSLAAVSQQKVSKLEADIKVVEEKLRQSIDVEKKLRASIKANDEEMKRRSDEVDAGSTAGETDAASVRGKLMEREKTIAELEHKLHIVEDQLAKSSDNVSREDSGFGAGVTREKLETLSAPSDAVSTRLRQELDETKRELRESRDAENSLKSKLEELKIRHTMRARQSQLVTAKTGLKESGETLSAQFTEVESSLFKIVLDVEETLARLLDQLKCDETTNGSQRVDNSEQVGGLLRVNSSQLESYVKVFQVKLADLEELVRGLQRHSAADWSATAMNRSTGLYSARGKYQASRVVRQLSAAEFASGVTSLSGELFVLRSKDRDQVEVYETTNFRLSRHLSVPGLTEHGVRDITSCAHSHCLYVADSINNCIHRVGLQLRDKMTKWPVDDKPGGLSMTSGHNLLVTCPAVRKLKEFTTFGQLLRLIRLNAEIANPQHAVQLSIGQFVVCHGSSDDRVHRVCAVDTSGQVVRSYGGPRGSATGQLDGPCHLAVDGDGLVFVADRANRRVLLLDRTLSFVRDVVSSLHGLSEACRLHLDTDTGRLYVGNNWR